MLDSDARWHRASGGELERSLAARSVGRMAAASGLFAAHFEHRLELPLPEWWCVPDADLGPYPWQPDGGWRGGSLHETKFRSFRLDRRIASFHPAHSAKWGAHELCHGLVGFGWKPGASMLWLATAARLAELVPVALWYFFDEAGLSRCPRHAGQGALFGPACPACERSALRMPGRSEGPDVERWQRRGREFVEAEIDAAWQTLKSGVPVSHRYGTLDLCTDGLAYARAHHPVLTDPIFAAWTERFCSQERGWHTDLDGLVARVRDMVTALSGDGDAAPLIGHSATWAAQDLGWRLLALRAEIDGAPAEALETMVDRLATAADRADLAEGMAVIASVLASYEDLFEEVVLPPPADLFAVGYPLPGGYGSAVSQLTEGLVHTLPLTCARLGDDLSSVVEVFAKEDPWVRVGIGDRFADWAARHLSGVVADQAALEAAVMHVSAPDPSMWALRGEPRSHTTWSCARHARPVVLHHDVGTDPEDPGTGSRLEEPACIAVVRDLDGTRELVALEPEALAWLQSEVQTTHAAPLDPVGWSLAEAGLLEPAQWQSVAPNRPGELP